MKGWVYVITNVAMPGLVKVGYSTKDPELRAKELNHTGAPHPYVVDYELLIEDPYSIEQRTHGILSAKREAKEWFRCSSEEAVVAIKHAAGSSVVTETYKRVERARAEALHQQQLRDRETAERRQKTEKEIANRLAVEESAIREKYKQQLSAFEPGPFWIPWCLFAIVIFVCLQFAHPSLQNLPQGAKIIFAIVGGTILAAFLHGQEKERKQSSEYLSLISQQQAELEAVRHRIVSCPSCGQQIRFDRTSLLLSDSQGVWKCSKCRTTISPPS